MGETGNRFHGDTVLPDASPGVTSVTIGIGVRYGLPANTTDGWWNCADTLAEPERFASWRKRLAEWLDVVYGSAPERTTAGYVMSWYLTVPGLVAGLLFHGARRAPSLRPADLAFRLGHPRPHPVEVAVLSRRFACLPDDPAAESPEATVVADENALAALLRARFAAHAAEFVRVFGPTTRLGRHTLWSAATDALDSGAWLAGKALGDEARGAADAALLLPAGLPPFTSASTLRPAKNGWTRRRESCCFHYVVAQSLCATCPRAIARMAPDFAGTVNAPVCGG